MTRTRVLPVLALTAAVAFAGCARTNEATSKREEPATIERIDGTDLRRVILTQRAAQRLDIQTTAVRGEVAPDTGAVRRLVPYSSVVYDPAGRTWVYVNSGPLTYVRHPIAVADIVGNQAVLSDGPAQGSTVVTVGAAELFGTETEVGH